MNARPAVAADAGAICAIYNAGIAERVATFETEPRTPDWVMAWLDGVHPAVVVEDGALVRAAEEAGFWKLVSRVFVENEASRSLRGLTSMAFRATIIS